MQGEKLFLPTPGKTRSKPVSVTVLPLHCSLGAERFPECSRPRRYYGGQAAFITL